MRGSRENVIIPSGHSFRVLCWEHSVREVECVLDTGRRVKLSGEGTHWHFHTEMELTLWIEGEGTRFVGDHIGTFQAGDLVLLGERLPHYWHAKGPSKGVSIQWHFAENHPFWAFPENLRFAELFKRAARGVLITGQTAAVVSKQLLAIPRSRGPHRLALLLGILSQIFGAKATEASPMSVRSFALSLESQYQEAVSKAILYIIANFRSQIRLEELLELTGLSRATFARQFKKHAGRTVSNLVTRLRLQAACRELVDSNRSVIEVAFAAGFNQVSLFNRLFRRELKLSPSEYRRKKARKDASR